MPALAALLSAEETTGIACLALRPNPSAQAGDALRDALAKAPGAARLQIVHTLGDRRDARAVAALTGLTRDRDALPAEAAMIALGKIANNSACRKLATLRRDPPSPVVASVAEASLYAAERLATAGKSRGARRIYEELLAGSYPDHTRRGAFEALLRLEPDDAEKRIREVLLCHPCRLCLRGVPPGAALRALERDGPPVKARHEARAAEKKAAKRSRK